MFRVDLVVHFSGKQILVLVADGRKRCTPGGVRRRGKGFKNVQSCLIERGERDLVVDETQRCRQGLDRTEIALSHGGGRNESRVCSSVRTQRGSLITAEEEELIFSDG